MPREQRFLAVHGHVISGIEKMPNPHVTQGKILTGAVLHVTRSDKTAVDSISKIVALHNLLNHHDVTQKWLHRFRLEGSITRQVVIPSQGVPRSASVIPPSFLNLK